MLISDLNHLETIEATQVIGGRSPIVVSYNKVLKVNSDVVSNVLSKPDVTDNVATGFVDSIANGTNTFTDSELVLNAEEGKSSRSTAKGVAVAAKDR
jgi:hypothetical protein